MKKRILTGLMAALLAASFASCGNNSTSTSASTESSKASESTSATEEASAEESSSDSDPAAEAIAARTEPAHLVVNWFTFTGAPAGLDRIEEKMNELTIPALNIEAKLQVTDYGSRSQQLTLQISGGEQLDIVQSLGVGYTNGIANDYWEDLEKGKSMVFPFSRPTDRASSKRWAIPISMPHVLTMASSTVFLSRKSRPADASQLRFVPTA